ncbi:family 16 glycoside hydrolase [Mucilaginibacter sp. UYCu711]|uniref:3-keto-disaccharide hydrolase n=1 Tax=Mucilaginibacter sp. UYCu711 TaxID=3156339 RepID=UPI003D1F849F
MHMGWPYFVKNSWLATPEGGLAVIAYGPMEINAVVANNVPIKIEAITNYPFEEQIKLNLSLARPASFPLKLRIPSWCANPTIQVNGKPVKGAVSGEILTINRQWHTKDNVTLNFTMVISTTKQVNNGVSIERGPLVYALKIEETKKNVKDFRVQGFHETEISPATPWNYGLLIDPATINKDIRIGKSKMPENPFVQVQTPVQLKIKGKRIPSWTIDYNKTAALDVPYSPVTSDQRTEELTLVPYGSEDLRVSIFPTIGQPSLSNSVYRQNFDMGKINGMVIYGGGLFCKDNAVHCASNGNNSSGDQGSKIVATGTNFTDFIYTADVKVTSPGDAGLMFRVSDPAIGANAYKGYYVGLNPVKGTLELGKANGKEWKVLASIKYPVKLNENYNVKIEAVGSNFKVFINGSGTPSITAADNEFKAGSIGLRTYNALATLDNLEIKAL